MVDATLRIPTSMGKPSATLFAEGLAWKELEPNAIQGGELRRTSLGKPSATLFAQV